MNFSFYFGGVFFFFLLFVSAGVVKSQPTLQLKEVYALLNEENIELKQAGIQVLLSEQDVKEAKNKRLPTASLSIGNNYNYGLSFDQVAGQLVSGNRWSKSANIGISSSLPLFDGFNTRNTIRKTNMQLKNAQLQRKETQRTLYMEAATLFYDILANKELYKAALEHVDLSKKMLEQESIQHEIGVKTKLDLALAKTRVASDETNVLLSLNAYTSRLIDMKQLLNIPLEDSIQLIPSGHYDFEDIREVLFNDFSLENSFNLAIAETVMEQATLDLTMAKDAYYPQVHLNASYGTNFSSESKDFSTGNVMPFFTQLHQNKFLYIGVSLTTPIFDAFSRKNAVNKAKLNIKQQENEIARVRLEEEKILRSANQDFLKAKQEFLSYMTSFVAAKDSYDAMKERYDVGIASYFELSTTLMEKNVSEFNLIQAKYMLLFTKEIMELLARK